MPEQELVAPWFKGVDTTIQNKRKQLSMMEQQQQQPHSARKKPAMATAKHGIAELAGSVYRLALVGMQVDKYTKTTKAIAEYVGHEFGQEMRVLVMDGKDDPPKEPEYPTGSGVTDKDKAIWDKKYDLFVKKQDRYKTDKAKVFSIVLGQCEKAMKHQVESATNYKTLEDATDVAGLLKIIKNVAYDANDKKYPHMQGVHAWKNLCKAW